MPAKRRCACYPRRLPPAFTRSRTIVVRAAARIRSEAACRSRSWVAGDPSASAALKLERKAWIAASAWACSSVSSPAVRAGARLAPSGFCAAAGGRCPFGPGLAAGARRRLELFNSGLPRWQGLYFTHGILHRRDQRCRLTGAPVIRHGFRCRPRRQASSIVRREGQPFDAFENVMDGGRLCSRNAGRCWKAIRRLNTVPQWRSTRLAESWPYVLVGS